MPIYRKSVCYFCGKPSTSTEHAPPQMFFRDFDCNFIKVPSCDSHNSQKSGDDQSIVSSLIQSLDNIKKWNSKEFSPDIEKAIQKAKSSIKFTKRRVKNVDVVDQEGIAYTDLPQVTYLHGDMSPWIKQLTAALIWNATKTFDNSIDWNSPLVKWLNRIPSNSPDNLEIGTLLESSNEFQRASELEQKIEWIDGWSASPRPYPADIYQFSFFLDTRDNSVIIRHTFYNYFHCYVLFSTSTKTMNAIQERALSYKANGLKR